MKDNNESENQGIKNMNLLVEDSLESIKRAAARVDGISGIPSGFHSLDKITSGWQRGDLITIASRPSMGKTAFALSMVRNIAVDDYHPTAFFSLEMTNNQLVNRMISNVCDIQFEKIRNGQLAPYEWMQLEVHLKKMIDRPIYIDDTPFMKLDDLAEKARELVAEKQVQLIIIDYIQLLFIKLGYTDNRYLELNYITKFLKSLAKELDIPIIILSQLNRDVEKREGDRGKTPKLSDLRDSGTLCDDSDIVCFIHRPEYYKIYEDDCGNSLRRMTEIIIAKQRNGAVGETRLRFDPDFVRFQDEYDIIKKSVSSFSGFTNLPPLNDDPFEISPNSSPQL